MADEKAPTDWAVDVKRYVPDADDGVIAKIVNYCGIALRSRDASLVSFTDKTETDRVRENYCKKLALEELDDVLDAAIAAVGKRMSDTNFRNRVTVYYLLAEHFGKLAIFGGAAAAAKVAPLMAAAPTAAAAPPAQAAAAPAAPPAVQTPVSTAKMALQALAGTVGGASNAGGGGFLGFAAVVFSPARRA